LPNYTQRTITRVDRRRGLETVAMGVRNSVGMDFQPKTRRLWFTNHARDWLGDDSPNGHAANRVSGKDGAHFGYPFCHQGYTLDPSTARNRSCAEFAKPSALLGTHIAPLGMKFLQRSRCSRPSPGQHLIARHGS